MHFKGGDDITKINRRTSSGIINPRYAKSIQERKELKREHKELAHTYRHLTKAEIAAQYPPERIEALVQQAKDNMQAMSGPTMDAFLYALT